MIPRLADVAKALHLQQQSMRVASQIPIAGYREGFERLQVDTSRLPGLYEVCVAWWTLRHAHRYEPMFAYSISSR